MYVCIVVNFPASTSFNGIRSSSTVPFSLFSVPAFAFSVDAKAFRQLASIVR